MKKEYSKRNLIGAMLPMLLVMFFVLSQVFLASIMGTFTDVPSSLVTMIITVPPLVSIVSSLAAGFLMSRFDKKMLLLLAVIIYFAAAMIAFFFGERSFPAMLVFAVLSGIGYGTINSVCNAAVAQMVSPESLPRYTGYNNGLLALGCMIMFSFAGILARNGEWSKAYGIGFAFVPIAVLILFCCPALKPAEKQEQKGGSETTETGGIPRNNLQVFILIVLAYVLYMMVSNVISVNLSQYVMTEYRLGTSVQTSIASNIASILSMIMGFLLMAPLSKLFKNYLSTFTLAMLAMCMLAPALLPPSIGVIYLSSVFQGIAAGSVAALFSSAFKAMPRSGGMTSGLMTACGGAGAFVCPFIMSAIRNAVQGTFLMNYYMGAVFAAVAVVLSVIIAKNLKKTDQSA